MLSTSDVFGNNQPSRIPPPLWCEAKRDALMDGRGKVNLETMLVHFLRQGRLSKHDALSIIQNASGVLRTEPNVLKICSSSVVIVGDIRGQFYDLAKIFLMGGMFSGDTTYLFLGNYVDRSYFSTECILFLLAAKLTNPASVFLLRGNNESRFMSTLLDFKSVCLRKYHDDVYEAIMEAFNCLPLAAVVNNQYFCVHGGLSPDVTSIDNIRFIYRFREPPSKGAMCDLLWSDPFWDVENPSSMREGSGDEYYTPGNGPSYGTQPCFIDNRQRGCSYLFNYQSVKHFLLKNNLLCVVRGHEVQRDGYKLYRFNGVSNFPCMMSVFSAPNCCDGLNNKGAIIVLEKNELAVKQFYCSPHPYVLPKQLNAFQWSFPYLLESLRDIFASLLISE
uniref:Uncharacterized protein TCIL3000_10_5520 n=1 Tax=Trypanosoma congolense (strain IL3000) TaxID=1068625 RepID=G0UWM0_TRYCI|nr:unnamed protein product [Trypanosoma congolense IL3000]